MDQQSEPSSQPSSQIEGGGTPRRKARGTRTARWTAFALALLVALGVALGPRAVPAQSQVPSVPIDHVIVIYLENRSFDNLYGLFAGADGLANAVDVPLQTDLDGTVYVTLPQPVDTYQQPAAADPRFPSDLPNRPFDIGSYVPPAEKTGDLIHAYYRQQYQIDGGRMDRFAYWSDAKGLALGYYDTSGLPLARWAREYTLADHFHHAAFGGSYLNHLWLICACTPFWPNPPEDAVSIPFPDRPAYLQDRNVRPDGYAVNTTQPFYAPYRRGTADDHRLPPVTLPHIGDRLDAAGVSWAWYAGGWNDAEAGRPGDLFQYHHQPFNYFADVGGDPAARARHLKDETDFVAALRDGTLPQVAWVKPYGADNEHPGYTDVITGELHVEELLREIQQSAYWSRTAVIITYDEHGGYWDHVAPPVVDEWGPGQRVPTLIISPWAKRGYVDHTTYDTTSILKLIEWRWSLPPLATRDATANNLLNAFDFAAGGAK